MTEPVPDQLRAEQRRRSADLPRGHLRDRRTRGQSCCAGIGADRMRRRHCEHRRLPLLAELLDRAPAPPSGRSTMLSDIVLSSSPATPAHVPASVVIATDTVTRRHVGTASTPRAIRTPSRFAGCAPVRALHRPGGSHSSLASVHRLRRSPRTICGPVEFATPASMARRQIRPSASDGLAWSSPV